MSRCVYTLVELNDRTPPDEQTASIEHIIPYALGGSDGFVLENCSKGANNRLGTDIDAPFIELPLLGMQRHVMGLKGHSGTIPALRFPGQCMGRTCSVVLPFDQPGFVDFGLNVQGSLDAGQLDIEGDVERFRGAIKGAIAKAKKKGLSLQTSGLAFETVEEALQAGSVSTTDKASFRLKMDYDNFGRPWILGILKIALCAGSKMLGDTWSFGPYADKIRMCLAGVADPRETIRGEAMTRLDDTLRTILDVRNGQHTVAILPSEEGMFALISLFGGDIFDSIIFLGDGPADVAVVNDTLPLDWVCNYRVDPRTRRCISESIEVVNSRVP